jgi:glutathione S-transferase
MLRRHDYVAEVVGGWAHAAHMCAEPRRGGRPHVPDQALGTPGRTAQQGAGLPDHGFIEALGDRGRVTKPVLWHIPVSHFSEKARWALAWKGVEHERRAPLPGAHIPIALWLTRGAQKTFPVLRLDGRNIGDSTAIIAALEQRCPDPPLYPEDPQARAHALELEEFFDERLGPQIRLLAWHELRTDREQMATLSRTMLPEPMRDFGPAVAAGGAFGSAYVQLRFRVASHEAAALAGDQVLAAFERLESELDRGDGEFLVGDAFSVADLTAASLFYPIVNPPEGPSVFGDAPPRLEEFFAPLRERPGGQWIAETFRRYREPKTSTTASISTGTSNGS